MRNARNQLLQSCENFAFLYYYIITSFSLTPLVFSIKEKRKSSVATRINSKRTPGKRVPVKEEIEKGSISRATHFHDDRSWRDDKSFVEDAKVTRFFTEFLLDSVGWRRDKGKIPWRCAHRHVARVCIEPIARWNRPPGPF